VKSRREGGRVMLIMGRTRRGRGVIFMTLNSMKGQNFTSKMFTGWV